MVMIMKYGITPPRPRPPAVVLYAATEPAIYPPSEPVIGNAGAPKVLADYASFLREVLKLILSGNVSQDDMDDFIAIMATELDLLRLQFEVLKTKR